MNRVALALCALLFAGCDPRTSNFSIDAGPQDASGLECDENPCLNGGTCNLLPDGFRCLCPAGYEGQLCETDVDDCEPNPCKNGGFCTDRVAAYQCECSAGYTGVDCSTDVDDCESNPCQHGTCTDMVNGFQCDCDAGYTGSSCEVDVDDCAGTPCDNGADCQDEVNGFTCICKAGTIGATCSNTIELCKEDTCKNGGTCADGEQGFECTCVAGYNGVNCETDIDDCAALPCQNGATCADQVNGYQCTCPNGYTGVNCELLVDPCNPNPCQNAGSCTSAGDYYVCSCPAGFNGADCENNIDDCASNPCKNGGSCEDAVNGFGCTCTTGYTGPTCNNEPPACPQPDPCDHGTCKDGVDGYKCECDAGFSGSICDVNVDDCHGDPCGAHGTCTDGENKFTCACELGYDGPRCQNDIDDCESGPCKNGGMCSDLVNDFSCQCAPGWAGDTCETNIDECDSNPCLHGGTCEDGVNDYTCACKPGYTGENCETDECNLIGVCGNGTCDGTGGCICEDGWQGATCNENIDECTTGTPCLHDGACTDSPGSFMCTCTTAYTGMICDACANGYQDNDDDGICCATGYAGATCLACDDGYENVNGLCKMTCTSSPIDCGDHGMCDHSGGAPACVCDQGYFGPVCDSLTGMCTSGTPCGANGDCSMTSDTTYKCSCDVGYTGRNCEQVDECAMAVLNNMTPCQNGGTCLDGNNTYTCQCTSGWLGADCSEADNCVQGVPQEGPCNGHGLCTDGNNAYTCACVTGWLGQTCAEPDDCVGNMCQHGGACLDGNATYTCDCSNTGYDGDRCQNKIDYCVSAPCKNGGVCSDAITTFQCDCAHTGYTGTTCETDADECSVQGVCGTGTCVNATNGGGHTCECPAGTIDVNRDGTTCSAVVSLAAGALNTCAITALGSLHCWGDNSSAQLGQGSVGNPVSITEIRTPYRIGTGTGWTKVSVGQSHVCAIRAGRLFCWGNDTNKQSAGISGLAVTVPLELRADLTWTDVSVGDEHSCALAGTALYCWGNSTQGQAGTPVTGSNIDAPQQIAGTWARVSAGAFHTCGITTQDQLSCWGRNTSNQLGGAGGITVPIAVPVGNNGVWTSVKAGPMHTCAVAGAKTYCWGEGTEGSLGNGVFGDSTAPVEVSAVGALGSLATGENFSCGILNDADAASTFQIYCWGSNANSLLLTADANVNVPQIVSKGGTPAWTAYAVGLHHMCAVENNLLYCWGSNADGAVGNDVPDPIPVSTATLVKTPTVLHPATDNCTPNPCQNGGDCTDSPSGFTCDCAGTGFGGATCTSESDECSMTPGICGQGTCRDRLDGGGYTCTCPDGLIDLDNTGTTCVSAKAISGGYNHTCVLTTSNTLHCWGSNRYGQFGLGATGTTAYYKDENTQTIRTPLRIKNVAGISTTDATGWTNFGVGESHTCGTIPNTMGSENLYCWGNNAQGQLGRAIASASDNQPAPYLLDSTHTWTALSVGYATNCGISGGQLYCWGYNVWGQAGNGTTTSPVIFSTTPVTLPAGETSWIAVAAGGNHTCAVTNTNTVYCWGRQTSGQTGIGATSTTPRPSPSALVARSASDSTLVNGKVSRADPQGFTAIATDNSHSCALVGTSGYCWGVGSLGSVGDGGAATRTSPAAVSGGLAFSSLTLGRDFSCGLISVMGSNPAAYTLSCWGSNAKNILLDVNKTQQNTPLAVLASRQWRAVDAAPLHMCAIDNADGKLYCWGDNGLESSVGQGKLGFVPYSALGNFDVGAVKAAAAIHAAP